MTWENLFGHASTKAYLKKNIAEEKFPHAVIFSGEEGIGKRLAAEICAAALLCENQTDGNPCGVCENCRLVAAKSHPDFYIVEAEETKTSRNIKIGQIRDMQAEASLRPINSARRVIIIDGAELMNKAASQTIFILLTASRSSLLMTIRSRCRTINFDKLSTEQIQDALITQGVELQEAQRLAIISNGSFGRALKLKDSGGAQLREAALDTLEKISSERRSATCMKFTRQRAGTEWVVNASTQPFGEVLEPHNFDLAPRLSQIKISERKIFLMIEAGAEFHKRLNSNASLRLLVEAYLMQIRKIYRSG